MRFKTLDEWLAWQEQLHPNPIDLGLHRVQRMLGILGLTKPDYRILTIGGTNGKGSSVAFAETMLLAGGYKVGAYTSPHLL
ncbi:MAG TPA: bifunctional folylpolyglutamate synthase/dihydrofolate synthase, partial [Gammaproteobacteria bacterium]|nr:bifunctional folylpolyglutamate synthase/dihydrofolate synthase [Gammaproteobacteria bacterium]